MAEGGMPSLETQKTEIANLLKQPLRKGDSWFLLDIRWYTMWKTYVGWDTSNVPDEAYHPGPIDNSSLFKGETGSESGDAIRSQLREHLVDELDYVLLPEEAWIKMVAWYYLVQNQEPIERFVIEQGTFVKHLKVEVYLMDLRLCENSDISIVTTHQFSRLSTIGNLEIVMRRLFGVNKMTDVRVWNRYMSNTYEHLNKKDNTLQDAGLYQGQVIVLEQRNDDGTWPRQSKGNGHNQASSSSANGKKCKQVKCDNMAAKIPENTDFECPVCHEDYDQPKMLSCKHTACHKCILTWLQKGGRNRGCPLCRVPILSPSTADGDLKLLVDALPTDLSVEIQMENQYLLKEPQYCAMCPNIVAITYCVFCGIKLCKVCTKHHQKLPITKDHHLTKLTWLTTKQPVSSIPSRCPGHQDKLVEFYCCGHQQLICMLCTSNHHKQCEVKSVATVAQEKRDTLKQQAQKLKTVATDMDLKLKNIQGIRGKVKQIFHELQVCIQKRQSEINSLIEAELKLEPKQHEQDKTAILFHAEVLNSLAVLSPDYAVIKMMQKMEPENFALQHLTERINESSDQVDLTFDSQTLSQLKTAIASLGTFGLPTQIGASSASPSTSDTEACKRCEIRNHCSHP